MRRKDEWTNPISPGFSASRLGVIPYPAGAIVFRDGRVKDLVAQEAAYALGGRTVRQPGEIYIGEYILEGSKPGAEAAQLMDEMTHRITLQRGNELTLVKRTIG